ncbi:MAG: GNAT family N-acetyltransferase [Kiloniellales bacterium]
MDRTLQTERLTLRPLRLDDAPAIQRLCGNWKVARMLSPVPYPYPDGLAEEWIASDARSRFSGEAVRFALDHEGELIGVMGLERQGPQRQGPERWGAGSFELGYWLGEPWWGRGLATEAARRVVAFAFEALTLEELLSGHFLDNPASGRVLRKCGFRDAGAMMLWSEARGHDVAARRLVLRRAWLGVSSAGDRGERAAAR